MHLRVYTVLASAGLAMAARAVDNTQVDWQVSLDNVTWQSTLSAQAGQTVYVRALVSHIGMPPPLGLASLAFQPTVSNWDLTGPGVDTLLPFVNGGVGSNTTTPRGVVTDTSDPTQFGRISPWGRMATFSTSHLMGHLHTGGSGGAPAGDWLRIAQAQATSWFGVGSNITGTSGVQIGQLNDLGRTTSDPAFDSALVGIQVFKFGIVLSADTADRVLVIDAPLDGFGNRNTSTGDREVWWYQSMNESQGSDRGTARVNPATLTVTCPPPGIQSQPRPVRASPCQIATFSVAAGSFNAPTYRWRRNGVNLSNGGRISGADTDTLTISPVGFFLGGVYDVVIANNCGVTTSDTALLDLADPSDYDGDGDIGTDADIETFFACLGGTCCASCLSVDFDGDGDLGTDADIEAFFRVLGGGGC